MWRKNIKHSTTHSLWTASLGVWPKKKLTISFQSRKLTNHVLCYNTLFPAFVLCSQFAKTVAGAFRLDASSSPGVVGGLWVTRLSSFPATRADDDRRPDPNAALWIVVWSTLIFIYHLSLVRRKLGGRDA